MLSRYIAYQEAQELKADEELSAGPENKSYGSDRRGEGFLRKVLQGTVDLDRTTLLSFLLFFDKESYVPESQKITEERLAEIVVNCGFPRLNTEEDPVDDFFVDYLNSDDPMMFLLQEAEIMAMSEENFYLYKTYLRSKSEKAEFERIIR